MGDEIEMPRYKCHKEVWALKIKEIDYDVTSKGSGTALVIPEDREYAPFQVDADYVIKHKPKPGGYYVVYKDGYKSWSPAEAFEGGYTRIN